METRIWFSQWEDGNYGKKVLEQRGKWKEPVPETFKPKEEEKARWQSPEHEGPCCLPCQWEEVYTDVGMANFGFGCCCRTTINDKEK